ncbi:hypothetical protein [Mycobacterium tuberculosis]|uniref:hypothetical protein n=1 Tax=Mycobacterium tuberculosis TaxID=1773 RepID=UPI00067B1315|nr:hypothetical protein [Mycobacterium tuberculosis]
MGFRTQVGAATIASTMTWRIPVEDGPAQFRAGVRPGRDRQFTVVAPMVVGLWDRNRRPGWQWPS